MAYVPVSGVWEAQMRMTLHDQLIENTLYFQKTGLGAADPVPLANALLVWWNASYAAPLSSELSLREIYLTDLTRQDAATYTQAAPTPHPVGGDLDVAVPTNCALCVSFRSAARGRSARGRNYVPGLGEASVNQSRVSQTKVDAVKAAYQGLFTALGGLPWTWVIVSRFTAGAPRPAGVVYPVTSVTIVDNVIDSQRRRLPGRGV